MDKENQSPEEPKNEKLSLQKVSSPSSRRLFKREKDPFPPRRSKTQWVIFIISKIALVLALLYLVEQFCSVHPVSWVTEHNTLLMNVCRSCVWGTYVAFGVVIAVIIIDRWIKHDIIVHTARIEDFSEVEALLVEARTVQRTSCGPMADQEYFDRKKKELQDEMRRLTDEIGKQGWTEYQVLSLNQMLVEFLEADELIARAQSSLEDLEDYADNKAYGGYDRKQYDKWKNRISEAIEKLDQAVDESKRNAAIEMLQARLETLLEHIANYNAKWSEGTAIISAIRRCGILEIFLLFPMGLLPILHPSTLNSDGSVLGPLNWGILGTIGAIIAVLLSLRKSDYVEVGNTEGKREFWRAFGGTGLGFAAGILTYSMFAGGLFTAGSIVPALQSSLLLDVGLSTVWALASGYCFENVFDRMVSTTLGGS